VSHPAESQHHFPLAAPNRVITFVSSPQVAPHLLFCLFKSRCRLSSCRTESRRHFHFGSPHRDIICVFFILPNRATTFHTPPQAVPSFAFHFAKSCCRLLLSSLRLRAAPSLASHLAKSRYHYSSRRAKSRRRLSFTSHQNRNLNLRLFPPTCFVIFLSPQLSSRFLSSHQPARSYCLTLSVSRRHFHLAAASHYYHSGLRTRAHHHLRLTSTESQRHFCFPHRTKSRRQVATPLLSHCIKLRRHLSSHRTNPQ
jgi:hypothetical protein